MYSAFFDLLYGLKTLNFIVDDEVDEIFMEFTSVCAEMGIWMHKALIDEICPY